MVPLIENTLETRLHGKAGIRQFNNYSRHHLFSTYFTNMLVKIGAILVFRSVKNLRVSVIVKILTVILYIKPSDARAYLPSSWRRVSEKMDGDAISVFNNGPLPGSNAPADAYYEISTYSPALNLAKGKSQFHLQRTFHFNGSEYDLGLIAYKLAGISIGQLRGESL